jgi:hypothetical protein
MPVARFRIDSDIKPSQMAVTDDYLWLFPRAPGARPLRFDRFSDAILDQMTQQWLDNRRKLGKPTKKAVGTPNQRHPSPAPAH